MYRNCLQRIQMFVLIKLSVFHALTQAHAVSDLCKATRAKSRNVGTSTLLAAKFPPLPNDFGRGDMLMSFRTMAYMQANIFLSAPYQTPKDELFQRATSFQDSSKKSSKHIMPSTTSALIQQTS